MWHKTETEIPDPGNLFALSCDSFFALLNGENDALSHKCKSPCTEYLCSLKITLRRVSSSHSSSSCYLFSILAGQVILVSRAVRSSRDPGMRAVHCSACGFWTPACTGSLLQERGWGVLGGTDSPCIPVLALCVLACCELGEAAQRSEIPCCVQGVSSAFLWQHFCSWHQVGWAAVWQCPHLPLLLRVLCTRLWYQAEWLSNLRMRNRAGHQTSLLSQVHWADRAAFGTSPTAQSPKLPHCNVF